MNTLKESKKDTETFQHGLDSLLNRSSAHWPEGQEEPLAAAGWSPLVDIGEGDTECRIKVGSPESKEDAVTVTVKACAPKGFRLLKWNELVRLGDFVRDEHRGLEPWEGPGGFRADAFVKPIYRKQEHRSTGAKKLK